MAICEESDNRGTLRKQIWNYLQTEFKNSVEYRDFLLSIQHLEKQGMIMNKTGHFFVEQSVYKEMVTQNAQSFPSTPVRINQITPK